MPENGERNAASREETLRRLREALGENVGRADAGIFRGQIDTIENDYDRDRDRAHTSHVKLDKYERVQEINSEYLDTKLESYLTQTLDTERANQERKYGRGLLGRAQRWLNETTIGKVTKLAGKATLGALCLATTIGTGGVAAPMLLGLGTSTLLDTAAEAVQYFGFEQQHVNALRQSRADRVGRVLRAMEIRNALHNEDDDKRHISDTIELNGARVGLNTELSSIITELDNIDQEVINREQSLARVRMWGNGIRTALKVASFAGGVAYGMTNGIPGIPGFDQGLIDLDGNGVAHKIYAGGERIFSFLRTQAEVNSAILAGNSLPLSLGAIPTATGYAAGIGAGLGLIGTAGLSLNEALRNRGFVQNPKETGVFSLRGRTELGNADQELSNISREPLTQSAVVDKETKIQEAKTGMETVGSVWKWKRDGKEEFFISKGFTADGVLKFVTIDPATGVETGNFTYAANGSNRPFLKASRLASDIEAFKESLKVNDAVKKIAEERGISVPKENDTLKPGNEFTLAIDSNNVDIKLDHDIIVHQVKNNATEAYIQVVNKNGNNVTNGKGWASMAEIMRNVKAEAKKEKKSGKESYKETLDSIKKIFEDKGQRAEFKTGIAVRVGTDWYLVGEVNESRGYIETYKVTGVGAAMPNKAGFAAGEHKNMNIEDFESLIKDKDKADLELAPGTAGSGGGGGRTR